MKIYYPLKPTYISQHFAENNACINRQNNVVGKRGNFCPSGYVDFYGERLNMEGHNGTDFGAYHNQPIYFPVKAQDAEGNKMQWEVHERDDNEETGIGLVVKSKKPCKFHIGHIADYGKEAEDLWARQGGAIHVKITFWHNKENDVDDTKGEPVKFGEQIATADNTGASSGTHLHFSVKLCTANGKTLDKDNGFRGAINHEPLMVHTPVVDFLERKEGLTARQQMDRSIFYFRRVTKKAIVAVWLERIKSMLVSLKQI